MAWTDEMVEGLKKMWKQGLTTNEIAKKLGVSKNSIVGKVHRLNLTARPSPIKKKESSSSNKSSETTVVESVEENVAVIAKSPKKTSDTVVRDIMPSGFEKSAGSSACLKLTELDNHTCRWPIGDPKDDNFCFCGKKVRSGQTYCEEHAALAYVKPGKK